MTIPLIGVILTGCGAKLPHDYTRVPGPRISSPYASDYLYLNPWCWFICTSSINAAASNSVGQGNTNSPTLMIAEKGAEMIREDARA